MKTNKQLMHIVNAMSPIVSNEAPERHFTSMNKDEIIFTSCTKRCKYEYYLTHDVNDFLRDVLNHPSGCLLNARWCELVEESSKSVLPGVKACLVKYAILLPSLPNVVLFCLKADWYPIGGTGDGALFIWDATLVQ